MKINFQFVAVLGSVGINLAAANCRTDILPRPDHFKTWDCHPSQAPPGSNQLITVGTRCYLECEDGFTPYSNRIKNYYVCRDPNAQHPNQGWRDGDGRPGTEAVKDAGRKLFFTYVRFKDGGGPRTDKISSKEDGGGQRTNPFRPPQGRIRTEDLSKFLKSGRRRTPDEGGPSPSHEP